MIKKSTASFFESQIVNSNVIAVKMRETRFVLTKTIPIEVNSVMENDFTLSQVDLKSFF